MNQVHHAHCGLNRLGGGPCSCGIDQRATPKIYDQAPPRAEGLLELAGQEKDPVADLEFRSFGGQIQEREVVAKVRRVHYAMHRPLLPPSWVDPHRAAILEDAARNFGIGLLKFGLLKVRAEPDGKGGERIRFDLAVATEVKPNPPPPSWLAALCEALGWKPTASIADCLNEVRACRQDKERAYVAANEIAKLRAELAAAIAQGEHNLELVEATQGRENAFREQRDEAIRERDDARKAARCHEETIETLRAAVAKADERALAFDQLRRQAEAERDHLAKFKAYAHERLDGLEVPANPNPQGEHARAGCRIGERFDWLRDRMAMEQETRVNLREQIDHHRDQLNAVLHPAGGGPAKPALCDLVAFVEGDLRQLRAVVQRLGTLPYCPECGQREHTRECQIGKALALMTPVKR
jgi:hypothetical protein